MDLAALNDRELVDLGCSLNGGTFGKDPARMNKAAKMAHIRDLATADVVEATARNILAGRLEAAPVEPPKPARGRRAVVTIVHEAEAHAVEFARKRFAELEGALTDRMREVERMREESDAWRSVVEFYDKREGVK